MTYDEYIGKEEKNCKEEDKNLSSKDIDLFAKPFNLLVTKSNLDDILFIDLNKDTPIKKQIPKS